MKIAIISDIHDNVWNLRSVLAVLDDADAMVCCGDLCAPFMVARLVDGFGSRPIHIVFGNNDGDLYRITEVASKFDNVQLHDELFSSRLGGRSFVATHYDTVAASIDTSKADVVCYGHNHQYALERSANCWVINPGAVMGYTPAGNKEIPVSYVIYDTDLHLAEGRKIGNGNRCGSRPEPLPAPAVQPGEAHRG